MKIALRAGLAVAAACLSSIAVIPAAQAGTVQPATATVVSSGPIRSMIPGKCAAVSDWNTAAPTAVVLQDCNGAADQTWTEYSDGSLSALGQCLTALPTGDAKYSTLEVVACTGAGYDQMWQRYNSKSMRSNTGWCVDDPSSSTANGVQLRLWDCNNTNAQWYSEPGGPLQTDAGFYATGINQAETYSAQSGTGVTSTPGGIRYVGWISNGDWTQYNNVHFVGSVTSINVEAAQPLAGQIEVHLDTLNNAPIATINNPPFGTEYSFTDHRATFPAVTGYHTVILRYVTNTGQDFMNVDWWQFS